MTVSNWTVWPPLTLTPGQCVGQWDCYSTTPASSAVFAYSGVHPSPEVCDSCGQLIVDMVLQALGKSYHSACFRCVICRQSLEGLPFTVDTDNKVYCVRDYHKMQAPRCAVCGLAIIPSEGSTESIRVVSFNRNYHVECYGSEVNLT
ncbi:LIM domain-containing protein 1 [Lampris incognitus]|uniref:LIM domain-containing protein 1 n=1 Tax=Lampris incognitus TaxID=2546036 RepID=UPI0024B4F5F0|nr:LIM domain-containing protein 1 [Lampris incognitus]